MARNRVKARRDADLRYAGEERGLAALLTQANSDYKTDRTVANAVAHSGARAARASRKPIRKAYQTAQRTAATAKEDVDTAFGALGAGADPFRAVTEREFALNKQRTSGAAAAAKTDAIAREREAKIGRVFALGAAKQQHNAQIHDLLQQAYALRGEKDKFTMAQLDEYRDQQRKDRAAAAADAADAANAKANRQNTLDAAAIGQGFTRDPKTGALVPIPGGKADQAAKKDKKFKPASRDDLRQFKSNYRRSLDWAKSFAATLTDPKEAKKAGGKIDRKQARALLTKGTLSSGGQKGVPAVDDQLAIKAALDMAYQGYLSDSTVRAMHSETGVMAKQLPEAITKKRYTQAGGAKKIVKTVKHGLEGILQAGDWS